VRKFVFFFGLLAVAVGVWLVAADQGRVNVCNTGTTKLVGSSVNANCVNVAWSYFGGFILVVGGALLLGFAMLLMAKHSQQLKQSDPTPSQLKGVPNSHHPGPPRNWGGREIGDGPTDQSTDRRAS
jgi:hypothetical protein